MSLLDTCAVVTSKCSRLRIDKGTSQARKLWAVILPHFAPSLVLDPAKVDNITLTLLHSRQQDIYGNHHCGDSNGCRRSWVTTCDTGCSCGVNCNKHCSPNINNVDELKCCDVIENWIQINNYERVSIDLALYSTPKIHAASVAPLGLIGAHALTLIS